MNTKRKVKPAARPVVIDHQVIIIGAGFSGLNMALRLLQSGITDFAVLERASDVGGTWRDNTYPGCACDVPSIAYSYSFAQTPEWTRAFAGSAEIHGYIKRFVQEHGLGKYIRLGVGVEQAVFNADSGIWTLKTSDGKLLSSRAVVSAVGGLVNPAFPDIPGIESFGGSLFHTARWDHACDLRGKRVAVIGTGASAVQVIPAIQPAVGELKVFQRTPAWVIPKPDFEIAGEVRSLFRKAPFAQKLLRNGIFLASESIMGPLVILDTPASRLFERYANAHLHRQVADPVLREKLQPDFHIGCKRVLISNDYYPALAARNVDLVTDDITRVVPQGVVTADGRLHEVDVIVLATGFKLDIANAPFEVIGLDGQRLGDRWREPGSKAYMGMAVSGFPNWFVMLGPNTGPGHTSVLVYTEAQAGYILQAVQTLLRRNLRYINVRRGVQDAWHRKLQERMKYTSWTSGCRSWYLDEHGENHTLFPGLASEYVWSVRHFGLEKYDAIVHA